jgi:hypothetical protein
MERLEELAVGLNREARGQLCGQRIDSQRHGGAVENRVVNAGQQMQHHREVRLRLVLFNLLKGQLERKGIVAAYERVRSGNESEDELRMFIRERLINMNKHICV